MFKIHNVFIVVASILLLTACNFSKPLEWFYYDRTKFSFTSEDEETQYIYLCVKGKTPQETEKRANQANRFFTEKLDKISEEFADQLFSEVTADEDNKSKDESSSLVDIMKLSMQLQAQSEKLAKEVEKQFQCLLIDSVDIE